jgi:tetratricopeptide (TPR) repeat protein
LAAVLIWPSIILWNQEFAARQATAVVGTMVLVATVVMAGAAGPWLGILGSSVLITPALILTSRGWAPKVPLVLAGSLLVTGILGGVLLREAMLPPPRSGDQQVAVHRRVFLENHGAIRRTNWLVAEEMFRSSPLTGRGAGNYAALWPEYRSALFSDRNDVGLEPYQPQAAQAHNEYFQFLGETGILGAAWALTCLGLVLVFWNRTWRALPDRQTRWQFLLLTAGLLVAGLHATVSFPFHLPATAMVLAMILGLLFSPVFQTSTEAYPVWAGHRLLAALPAVICLFLGVGALREMTGDLHLASGQQDFALARLEAASRRLTKGIDLSRWPGDGPLYLGLVQVATGQPSQARLSLENSLAENPTFEGYLALAELSIDQGQFTEAAGMLTIVEGCEPYVEFRNQAAYLRGLSELRQGRHGQAYDQFRRLLEADPTNQRAWLAIGYLAVLAGEQEQARNFYGRALEIIDRKIKDLESESGEPHSGEMVRLYSHRETAQKALNSIK